MGETKKVTSAIRNVEAAARRLAGVKSWGMGFQRQLDKLKLSAADLANVELSWLNLHQSMKSRNLSGTLKSSEISHWKTGVVSALAQTRAEFDRHTADMERRARTHSTRMGRILRPAFVLAGAYTAPYFAGIMGREALSASSERRREIFRQRMANIPDDQRETLFAKSEELGAKYPSLPITSIMELARSTYSTMGDAERAAAVLERLTQSLVVLQSAKGPDAAVQHLIGLIRGLDNLGINADGRKGIDQVNALVDAATKAAQVDPDFDPGQFFAFARRSKVAGPALSPDFLARASVYMQDQGPDVAGNSLAMAFKAFVLEAVGSAGGKKYLKERQRIGIRNNDGLIDAELFGSDPDQWVVKHLIPALRRDGVDLENNTQVAAAIGKLSGNTNATGLLTRIVTQREQIERWLRLMNEAMGSEVAGDVRFEDPFVGLQAFKKSLENLSAALVPIDHINRGLNGLADAINALAASGEDTPLAAALGIGGAGYGLFKSGKFLAGKLDMFGLKASAVALDGSAAALTRAAVALGGAGTVDGGLPGKKGLSGLSRLGLPVAATIAGAAGTAFIVREMSSDNAAENQRLATHRGAEDHSMHALKVAQGKGEIEAMYEELLGKAKAAGMEIESSLNVTAKPEVDDSALDRMLAKLGQIRSGLASLNARAAQAERKLGVEMRRNFADAMP
ncbi:MAG: hypothetical protein JJ911_01380 [Rhizobiaceae bacterium]|nr:hypothetical protein [Rhizobiaceae bacterium]